MKNVSKLLSILLCLAMVIGIFAMTGTAAAGDTANIVSNPSQLANNDKIILVNDLKTYAMAASAGNYFGRTAATVTNDSVSVTADMEELTVVINSDNTYSFKTENGKYLVAVSGSNYLKTADSITAEAKWTISIASNNNATITNNSANKNGTKYQLQYNSNSGQERFSGYTGTQKAVRIYKIAPSDAPTVNVTGVTLDKTTASIEAGASVTLTATVAPNNATNQAVTWTSSDNTGATVSGGKVTGVKAGTATITATTADGNKTATCAVTVTAAPIVESGLYVIWNPGSGKALSANPSKDGSFYNGGVDVTLTGTTLTGYGETEIWVVTANDDGTITIATQDGKKFSMDTAYASTPFDKANDKWILNTAADGQYYIINVGRAGQYLQWRAGSDYNYFSCYTSPTVASYGFTFTKHTVAVSGVTLDKTTQNLTVGGTVDLVASVAPSNATNQNVTWTSSDETVATVANGKVTAVKAGTATITVTTADGSKTATCTITVVAATVPATGVTLDKTTASLEVGKDVTLSATVAPADSTDAVVWSSSDATIATVAGGKVTALKAGTVTITAKAGDKTATCTVTITAPVVEEEEEEDNSGNTGSTTPSTPAAPTWTIQAPKAGASFKFGLNQKGLTKQLWFTGEMDGNFLATSDDAKKAVDVVVEAVEGGYRLSFTKDGVKKYIDIIPREGETKKASITITDTPTAVLTWDATAKTFLTKIGEETFYMGTYGTYKTISVSNTSYITGDNASKVDVSQYIAHLYLDSASTTGDAFEPMVIVLALAAVSALAVLALNKKKFSF